MLREKAAKKLELELHRIKTGTVSKRRRRRMVQRHITPTLAYGSAWHGFANEDVLARKSETTIFGKRWCSRSVTCTWGLGIGIQHHPGFVRDFETVRVRVRRLRKIAREEAKAWSHTDVRQREEMI